jgi:hypothetical protein
MKFKSLLAITALSLTLAGCGGLNKENYDKLTVGMKFEEVTDVMGSPESCSETLGTKRCIWGDEEKHIKVSFIADNATFFSNKGL